MVIMTWDFPSCFGMHLPCSLIRTYISETNLDTYQLSGTVRVDKDFNIVFFFDSEAPKTMDIVELS